MSKRLDSRSPNGGDALSRYWRKNLFIMSVLLLVWAAVGLGAGVLFADSLNAFHLGGYPLGFWFAQQGSIIVFVLLILIYAIYMNRLDREHHDDLASDFAAAASALAERKAGSSNRKDTDAAGNDPESDARQ